jgi:hypothetical protein
MLDFTHTSAEPRTAYTTTPFEPFYEPRRLMPKEPPPARRFDFDGTLRTAYTQVERLKAQSLINDISCFKELLVAASDHHGCGFPRGYPTRT